MRFIRPIASIFLAGIVLFSSVGVTINSHWCGGHVQSIAIFMDAQPCAMELAAEKIEMPKGCCEEHSLVFKGKDTSAEVKIPTQLNPSFNFIAIILPALYNLIPEESVNNNFTLAHYKPPLAEQDITLLVHSFLI